MSNPDSFLNGTVVYLRRPNLQIDVIEGEWHHWFNDYETTRYLSHGFFPITRDEELEIVKSNMKRSDMLLLTIVDIDNDKPLGLISLSDIDPVNRRAEIAIVMGKRKKLGAALEAMALLTQHAFDRLNLDKIYAGQHEKLWKWVNTLELIGYKIEGYREKFGRRNCKPYGVVLTGVEVDNFNELRSVRDGKILGDDIYSLMKSRSKKNKVFDLAQYLKSLYLTPEN
ncbi:GNAT family N-acetyltransferase [Phormidium yuhuli AB48]|uniref:GNAT family N-acetyltransferase n=1 Tax=Phormidium yuhuli AB48 TaxID=2940671 RepID=A0ABY5AMD8_9CYAN|nr:GNAT family protein [Phormidium yuhuli]USR89931.1 GNAT family N-acetyltransferase [Phormidium yuhuli AB48]